MGADKLVPGGHGLRLGSRWEATALEDVAHRLITDMVTQMCQSTRHAIIAPAVILLGYAHHQVFKLLVDAGASKRLASLGAIELLHDERPMPGKDRLRFDEIGH